MIELELIRDGDGPHNFGKFFVDKKYFCETLEDPEREEKIDGDTAIPCGRYRVSVTFSHRFQRLMPLVHDVPGFTGIRLHGGNTEADTHGCPLLGNVRTGSGIAMCAGTNQRLMNILLKAETEDEEVWLTVS